MSEVEPGRPYSIPIPDTETNSHWQQTREIPVIHTEFRIPGSQNPITYLRFAIDEGHLSPLDILAGGENPEIAGKRIRAQMMHRLETSQELLQREDPPPGLVLSIQVINQYFTPRNDSNAQHGL